MAKGTRVCEICGKTYPYCKSLGPSDRFRWQDVACCPEHASLYFARVEAARRHPEGGTPPTGGENVVGENTGGA